VSAKYKGAFCEAKVRSVDKQVKCRVTFKMGLGSTTISDKDIKTDKPLIQGATVLAKHPDKQDYFEAIVKEIKVSRTTGSRSKSLSVMGSKDFKERMINKQFRFVQNSNN
jgi:hypothetical protein